MITAQIVSVEKHGDSGTLKIEYVTEKGERVAADELRVTPQDVADWQTKIETRLKELESFDVAWAKIEAVQAFTLRDGKMVAAAPVKVSE